MKLSKKKTNQILIKAQVCSEWDSCTHCLVEFIAKDIERWSKYDKVATELSQGSEFNCLSIWEYSEFLYLYDGKEEILKDKDWGYVIMSEKEIEDNKPEQKIDALQIKFHGMGGIQFIGYGKHTSEEFWSETINIQQL